MRSDRARIVRALEAEGLTFRTFEVRHRSPHPVADLDWNQRDLPHVSNIHGAFRFAPAVLEADTAIGLYVQEVLGVRLPMTVTFHHRDGVPGRVYTTAVGPIALVVETSLAAIDGGSEETTTYSVGAPFWARPLLPLAERLLRRNADRLRAEDAPMLARRQTLRRWGYRFRGDEEGAAYDRSLAIAEDRVVPPEGAAPPEEIEVPLAEVAGERRIGRDDHLGLRVVVDREAGALRVYPRMCPHEGASLDGCPGAERGPLVCPWHGRRVPPLAELSLEGGEAETAHHRLCVADGVLRVGPR